MRSRLIGWEELGRVSVCVCVCVCVCVIFAFMLVLWTYHCASCMSGSCDFPRLSVNVFLQFELVIQFCISVPRAQPAVARVPTKPIVLYMGAHLGAPVTVHTPFLCVALCLLPLAVAQCLPARLGSARPRRMHF